MCLTPLYMYQARSEYEDNDTSNFVRGFTYVETSTRLHAYHGDKFTANFLRTRKKRFTFNPKLALDSTHPITVPCGKCAECRKRARRDWSTRIQNEASMHEESCFITLTYNDENLPKVTVPLCIPYVDHKNNKMCYLISDVTTEEKATLRKTDVQLFLKRLRARLLKEYGKKIRFYCVGEYGAKRSRPHYHLIIFGHDFRKTRKAFRSNGRFIDYVDDIIADCWKFGYHTVNDYSPATASYVAGYVTKKMANAGVKVLKDHIFALNDAQTEELNHYELYNYGLEPEFHTMSRRDGIGKSYMMKYFKEVFSEHGFRIRNGTGKFVRVSIPRRYLAWLKEIDEKLYNRVIGRMVTYAQQQVQRSFQEIRRLIEYYEHTNKLEMNRRQFENTLDVRYY